MSFSNLGHRALWNKFCGITLQIGPINHAISKTIVFSTNIGNQPSRVEFLNEVTLKKKFKNTKLIAVK